MFSKLVARVSKNDATVPYVENGYWYHLEYEGDITTGLHDSQVQYFEPMKWMAKLREMKPDDNLLLFGVNMESGHGGAPERFERLKRIALEYAFVFELAGIEI